MRWTKRRTIVALVVAGALAASTAAVASHRSQPDTDEVEALVDFTHAEGKFRECEGVDGPYVEQFVRAVGPSTGDPRLSGEFEIRIYLIVNLANGVGIEEGTFRIRDSETGRLKARGFLQDAGTAEISQGVIFGRVFDDGTGPGEETQGDGQLNANYRVTFTEDSITAQIGGTTADGRIPAVIWSGQCRGPWTPFESEIGGEPAAPGTAATSRSMSHWGALISG